MTEIEEKKVKKITELNRLTSSEFEQTPKIPLTIVLDNVRSMNNIGSVFRTADAFLVSEIILCGITAFPPHAEIHKTALGAEDTVKWQYFKTTEEAVDYLKQKNVTLCALELTRNSISLENFDFAKFAHVGIIVGNEVKGVQQSIVDSCDYAIEIPQFGTKHSLNVSIATGLAIWECFKKSSFIKL